MFFSLKCYENLGFAIATQEGLSIEYDESVCCDVCQSVRCFVVTGIYILAMYKCLHI